MNIIKRIQFSISNNINMLITGAPGIGKTKIVLAACKDMGIKDENIIFIHASIKSPTDFTGLPFRKSEYYADFLPYGDLHRMITATEKLVVFLDDLGQGSTLVQAAVMQLIEERRVGEHKISEHVAFVLATNRTGDGAGVSKLLEPLKGRCAIYELHVDSNAWLNWAISANINPIVCAFIKNNPSALHDFVPSSEIINYASPRNYERLSKFANENFFEQEDAIACIGNKYGIEFYAFFKTFNDISHIPKQIATNPHNAEIPSRQYYFAIITVMSRLLVNKFDESLFDKFVVYLSRLNENELKAWSINYIILANKDYIQTNTYLQFAANR